MKPIAYPGFSISLPLILVRFLGIHMSFVRSQKNHTLIFTKENTLRNCSCSVAISDCDYCLANLMCNCKTVLPSTMEKTTYNSHLTIWFTDTPMLEMVLSFTRVWDLKLSFCGTTPLPTEYLAIWGVRNLQVNMVRGQFPEQSVTIPSSNNDKEDLLEVYNKDRQMLAHISFLDTSLFNGDSLLKSYSVENVSSIMKHFPGLLYSDVFSTSDNERSQNTIPCYQQDCFWDQTRQFSSWVLKAPKDGACTISSGNLLHCPACPHWQAFFHV